MNRVTPGLRPGDRMRTAAGMAEWADAAIAKLRRELAERERRELEAFDRNVVAPGGPGVVSFVDDYRAVHEGHAHEPKPRRRWWRR